MGSTSDMPVMRKAADFLNSMQIPFEINALSAHRVPEKVEEFATNAQARGIKVIIAGAGGAALKVYLEGDGSGKPSRFTKQATNLSRGIKGPYFFGDSPSYADFFLCQHMDWQDEMCLRRLREEIQLDCFGPYPKIKAVVEGIRNLDSYKNYSGPLKTCGRPGFVKEDDFFAAYK